MMRNIRKKDEDYEYHIKRKFGINECDIITHPHFTLILGFKCQGKSKE